MIKLLLKEPIPDYTPHNKMEFPKIITKGHPVILLKISNLNVITPAREKIMGSDKINFRRMFLIVSR